MNKKFVGLLIGGLALASPASPALAAGPATVTVRVEASSGSLLAPTTVTTTTAPVVKDGTDSCTGTSAAGALELATAGDWDGAWGGAGMGYEVDRIKTVDYGSFASNPQYYWALAVNGVSADSGVCGVELQAGDDVLLYTGCAGATSGCFDSTVLGATAPATVAPGQALAVAVKETSTTYPAPSYNKVVSQQAASGATVAAGAASVTTGADGTATLTLSDRGPATIRVTKANDVPDQISVCVTDGADGYCGTTKPGATPTTTTTTTPTPCTTNGHDGFCGTKDAFAAYGFIASVKEGKHYTKVTAPRELSGRVDQDASGIKDVEVRLTRMDGPRCATYDGARERFARLKRCGAVRGRWFSVGDRADWSYLLPSKLTRGRYVLDVRVTDKADNRDATLARGRNRVVFFVA